MPRYDDEESAALQAEGRRHIHAHARAHTQPRTCARCVRYAAMLGVMGVWWVTILGGPKEAGSADRKLQYGGGAADARRGIGGIRGGGRAVSLAAALAERFTEVIATPRQPTIREISRQLEDWRHHRLLALHNASQGFKYGKGQPGSQTMVFFTHIRRTGGSTIENELLDLKISQETRAERLARLRRQRMIKNGKAVPPLPPSRTLNCHEGYHARYYDFPESRRHTLTDIISNTELQWRHCPFGLHTHVRTPRRYVYFTMLRAPAARTVSWHKFIERHRKMRGDKTVPTLNATVEWYAQRNAGIAVNTSTVSLRVPDNPANFVPPLLEVRLDDNYQTRMICGAPAHNATIVNEEHLKCAMQNLMAQYAVTGVQERFDESVCLLAKLLNMDTRQAVLKARKSKENPGKRHEPSEDVLAPPGGMLHQLTRYDRILHRFAMALLDHQIATFAPECADAASIQAPSRPQGTVRSGNSAPVPINSLASRGQKQEGTQAVDSGGVKGVEAGRNDRVRLGEFAEYLLPPGGTVEGVYGGLLLS